MQSDSQWNHRNTIQLTVTHYSAVKNASVSKTFDEWKHSKGTHPLHHPGLQTNRNESECSLVQHCKIRTILWLKSCLINCTNLVLFVFWSLGRWRKRRKADSWISNDIQTLWWIFNHVQRIFEMYLFYSGKLIPEIKNGQNNRWGGKVGFYPQQMSFSTEHI